MANYWAIIVGINQYQFLQPLMHAQNDALALRQFLVESAGFRPECCLLLSEGLGATGYAAIHPDRSSITRAIQNVQAKLQPDDLLWIFFSGYGVQLEQADYLMPLEGDPGQIAQTGIAIEGLMTMLSQAPTHNIVLALDINRSQGALANQTIGSQTLQLAKTRDIPTLLSCQPEQFSHETLALRHGLFTAALLEGMGAHGCVTLDQIAIYLSQRLPQLCDHHWRPIQNSVAVLPGQQKFLMVIPQSAIAALPVPTGTALSTGRPEDRPEDCPEDRPASRSGLLESPVSPVSPDPATEIPGLPNPGFPDPDLPDSDLANLDLADPDLAEIDERLELAEDWDSGFDGAGNAGSPESSLDERLDLGAELSEDPTTAGAIAEVELSTERRQAAAGSPWRNWALAAVLVAAVGGFLLVNQGRVDQVLSGLAAQLGLDADDGARIDTATEPPDPAPAAGEPVAVTAADSSDEPRLDQARAAIANQQYSEALALLQQVPEADRTPTYEAVLDRAQAGVSQANQVNASALAEAKTSIQPTQATPFATAIAKARQIPPGEPYYEQAQQDIDRWSQVILDLAEGRAASGNLESAIAAARVLPMDRPQLYEQAQNRIAFWQQRLNSRQIIQQAQDIPRAGQASSYQQGIVKLEAVPVEHPEYDTARQLRDEWSERMLSIAQARAAQGRTADAIRAAVLIPPGTAAYEPAQQAIQRWKE